MCASPFRKVPVVMMTAPQRTLRPSRSRTPRTRPSSMIERRHFRLLDAKIRLAFQHLLHPDPVLLLVALRARRPDRRTAAGIQQPELDPDRIGHLAHHAAQRVDLAHQVTLGDAADRRDCRTSARSGPVHRDHRGRRPMRAQARAASQPAWPRQPPRRRYCSCIVIIVVC